MKKILFFAVVLFFSIGEGCATHPKTKTVRTIKTENSFDSYLVDPQPLRTATNLVVLPFRAGAGVESGPELERLSLTIFKALAEGLKEAKPPFTVLIPSDNTAGDMVLEGYITEFRLPRGRLNPPKTYRGFLAVEGKVVRVTDEKALLSFSGKIDVQNVDPLGALSKEMGQNIAELILRQAQKGEAP